LPALFLLGSVAFIVLACKVAWWWILPLVAYFMMIFVSASVSTRSLKIGLLAVPAAAIQLWGYGYGFIKAFVTKILLRQGRNVEDEIRMRKGE
ncbi:MAG: glycosyl transferase family 2, partial [Muribaculaceae bacterium]|nr:glycosyl transferase family 2 [Muribaculaceae bacterium]